MRGTEPELAAVIRETKILPLREANRRRLRRVLGHADDPVGVDERADAGVGLIVLHFLAEGRPMTPRQIADRVIPMMTGSPAVSGSRHR